MGLRFSILALVIALSACTAPMTIDIRPEDEKLVIYSTLIDGVGGAPQTQWVSVQHTLPYFSAETEGWIADAEVAITDTSAGTVYPAMWNPESKNYVTATAFAPQPNVTYALDVRCDFDGDGTRETYHATAKALPTRMTIDRMELKPEEMFGLTMYKMLIWARDLPGPDSYLFRIAINGEMRTKSLKSWHTSNDGLFDGSTMDEFMFDMFSSKQNERNPDPEQIWLEPGQRVTLIYANVEPGLAQFIGAAQSSGGSNPMFGGPPSNAGTNISGGAIGFFGAVCSSQVSATVPGGGLETPVTVSK